MTNVDEARIEVTDTEGTVTITGGGVLTYFNAAEFGQTLKQASLNAESVIVDLRPAFFIDTQIVQDLGKGAVTLLNRGKRLKVMVSATAYPLQVLKISNYQMIMDVMVDSEPMGSEA